MNNMIRIVSCTHEIKIGNPVFNALSALKSINEAKKVNPDIIVLPALALTGISGEYINKNLMIDKCSLDQLSILAETTKKLNMYIITSIFKNDVESGIVLYKGEIFDATSNGSINFFDCGSLSFCISLGDPEKLFINANSELLNGVDIIINPSCKRINANSISNVKDSLSNITRTFGCAVCTCNGNFGESTAPFLYKCFAGIFENGEQLAWQIQTDSKTITACADIDEEIIKTSKAVLNSKTILTHPKHSLNEKYGCMRSISQNPYIPTDCRERLTFLEEVFDLQTRSLMGRMSNTGICKLVVGCSGGLDSTLALLVAASSIKRLNLPKDNLIGITMPGFGTTNRTYENSLKLIDGIGAKKMEIPIANSVRLHLEDIGHSIDKHDVTYENAQARERTQILFDVANMENALVVGTGDLSEAALGWCTFGGDQFASFNVNSCVTKTLARLIVEYLSATAKFIDISQILKDILQTPVSPELLPADTDGNINQLTESILGDYILHDFYLYYFVKYNMSPIKIYEYALEAFGSDYPKEEIYRTLEIFIKRFFSGQFKRASSPEASDIMEISLSSSRFRFPSDATAEFMLKQLKSVL